MKDHDSMKPRRKTFKALVDIERDGDEDGWVTFDCFSRRISRSGFYGPKRIGGLLTLRLPLMSLVQRFPTIEDSESQWVQLIVASHANEKSVEALVVMFGDNAEPVVLHICDITPLQLSQEENHAFMLTNAPRSPETLITGVLDFSLQHAGELSVAAYDVGQGNCNAIIDEFEHPRVFFDLGWAPNFHAWTRPPRQPNFFSCDDVRVAPVVLSHWDMDHWSYAIARSQYNPASLTTRHEWNPKALARFWIARAPERPEHQVSPLALSFYEALTNKQLMPGISAMLLWPDDCAHIRFSEGWLEACEPTLPTPSDRNNTGIAMFVQQKGQGPAILMTGDADFPSIPSLTSNQQLELAGMVAPHHGSKITMTSVPRPKPGTPMRLVLSVGKGNGYGHPTQASLNAYQAAGWHGTAVLTQDRQICRDAHRHKHAHGNVILKFSVNTPDPLCSCWRVLMGGLCMTPSIAPTVPPIAGVKPVRLR